MTTTDDDPIDTPQRPHERLRGDALRAAFLLDLEGYGLEQVVRDVWAIDHAFVHRAVGEELPGWNPRALCPRCGSDQTVGYTLVGADGQHVHTRYACRSWPWPGPRCGWTGWRLDRPSVGDDPQLGTTARMVDDRLAPPHAEAERPPQTLRDEEILTERCPDECSEMHTFDGGCLLARQDPPEGSLLERVLAAGDGFTEADLPGPEELAAREAFSAGVVSEAELRSNAAWGSEAWESFLSMPEPPERRVLLAERPSWWRTLARRLGLTR